MSKFSHRGLRVRVPHLSADQITYLLDVVFSDYADDPAPVASPIVGRTGELTFIQNAGETAISGGKLTFTKAGTPAWENQQAYYNALLDHDAGLVLYARSKYAYNGASGGIGEDPIPGSGSFVEGWYPTSGLLSVWVGSAIAIISSPPSQYDNFAMVLRNQGAFFVRNNVLAWVHNAITNDFYPSFLIGYSGDSEHEIFRLASLPANASYPVPATGTRDLDLCTPGTGSGTSKIDTPAAGNTFVHTADSILQFTQGPLASFNHLTFRESDYSGGDYWDVYINVSGTGQLREFVGGDSNVRGSLSGVINGDIISIILNGNTISVYINDTLSITYASATNWSTSISGRWVSINGSPSNFTARTLDGVANVGSSNFVGYGLATDVLPGPRAANDEATREVALWGEITIPAIPTASTLEYAIRYIDANNYVYLEVDTAGDFDLREVTGGGASSSLATNAAGISGGERLIFIDGGSSIKVYYDVTLAINQSTSLHNTATLTRVLQLGTAGQLSNAINFPLTPGTAPSTPAAAAMDSALTVMATA